MGGRVLVAAGLLLLLPLLPLLLAATPSSPPVEKAQRQREPAGQLQHGLLPLRPGGYGVALAAFPRSNAFRRPKPGDGNVDDAYAAAMGNEDDGDDEGGGDDDIMSNADDAGGARRRRLGLAAPVWGGPGAAGMARAVGNDDAYAAAMGNDDDGDDDDGGDNDIVSYADDAGGGVGAAKRAAPRGLVTSCPAGNRLSSGTCFQCTSGKYSLGGTATVCTNCPAGKFGQNNGLTTANCQGDCVRAPGCAHRRVAACFARGPWRCISPSCVFSFFSCCCACSRTALTLWRAPQVAPRV
jgi:hypothetical protein